MVGIFDVPDVVSRMSLEEPEKEREDVKGATDDHGGPFADGGVTCCFRYPLRDLNGGRAVNLFVGSAVGGGKACVTVEKRGRKLPEARSPVESRPGKEEQQVLSSRSDDALPLLRTLVTFDEAKSSEPVLLRRVPPRRPLAQSPRGRELRSAANGDLGHSHGLQGVLQVKRGATAPDSRDATLWSPASGTIPRIGAHHCARL